MPKPLQGLIAIAEYGSKLEADAIVAQMRGAGIEATPSYDPAMNSVAPYFATDRTFEVLVRVEDRDRAEAFLAGGGGGLPAEFTEAWQPTTAMSRVRGQTRGCLIVAMVLMLAVIVLVLAAAAIGGR